MVRDPGGRAEPGAPAGERGGPARGWQARHGADRLFLEARGRHVHTATIGPRAFLLRGYAVRGAGRPGPGGGAVLDDLARRYAESGELPIDGLEGSFTLAVLDGAAGQVLLYRNIVGAGFTYYAETPDGLIFSGNLADLVGRLPDAPSANAERLPALFLYRSVPGRETLFRGIYRLMPGEQVRWDARGLRRVQRQTIDDLRQARPGGRDADPVDLVERGMERIFADYAALHPRAVNLLSGGVDSSYIQVHWNRACAPGSGPPRSYSAHVEHPHTRVDSEYATTAARALGTRHELVPVGTSLAEELVRAIASTGEPPNHVQSIYLDELARVVHEGGFDAALCGEGADSLFGLGELTFLQMAERMRRLLPSPRLRRAAASLARATGHPRLPAYLELADRIGDLAHEGHPVNQVAVLTTREAAHACFGPAAIAEALDYRRQMLRDHNLGDVLEQTCFAGYLGEAINTASFWDTAFNARGCTILFPFLDSRMIRLAVSLDPRERYPFRRPKALLKGALKRHVPGSLVDRPKRGFGQPIFEWMSAGGPLRELVDRIGTYDFVDPASLSAARERPNWFLYTLLCYDVWYKAFVEQARGASVRRRDRESVS